MTSSSSSILLLALCGLPASGKSTLAKRIQEYVVQYPATDDGKFSSSSTPTVSFTCDIVSFDAIYATTVQAKSKKDKDRNNANTTVDVTEERWSPERWQESRHIALQELHRLIQHYRSLPSSTPSLSTTTILHLIIIDDNLWLRSMRKDIYRCARDYRLYYVCLYLPILSLDQCIARDQQRQYAEDSSSLSSFPSPSLSAYVGENVIRRMAENFQPPIVIGRKGTENDGDTKGLSKESDRKDNNSPTATSSSSSLWDSRYTLLLLSSEEMDNNVYSIPDGTYTLRNDPVTIIQNLISIVTDASDPWLPSLTSTIDYQHQRNEQSAKDREKTAKSIMQQSDLCLRSLVNTFLTSVQSYKGKSINPSSSSSDSSVLLPSSRAATQSPPTPEPTDTTVTLMIENVFSSASFVFHQSIQQLQSLGNSVSEIRKTVLNELQQYVDHYQKHHTDLAEKYGYEIDRQAELGKLPTNDKERILPTQPQTNILLIYEPSLFVYRSKDTVDGSSTEIGVPSVKGTTTGTTAAQKTDTTSSSSSSRDTVLLSFVSLYELDQPWIICSMDDLHRFVTRLFLFRIRMKFEG